MNVFEAAKIAYAKNKKLNPLGTTVVDKCFFVDYSEKSLKHIDGEGADSFFVPKSQVEIVGSFIFMPHWLSDKMNEHCRKFGS